MNRPAPSITLTWHGPFSYNADGITPSLHERHGCDSSDWETLRVGSGLYLIIGDDLIHGERSLLYIGRTKENFGERLADHKSWLRPQWRLEIYLAPLDSEKDIEDCEKLLIYAHTPILNSANTSSSGVTRDLRILNTGRFWRLYPEVSSDHEWFS